MARTKCARSTIVSRAATVDQKMRWRAAADSAAKLAMTLGVITSTQAGEIATQVAGTGKDELEVLGEIARLADDVLGRLARRVIGARAARCLAPAEGEFVVVDDPAVGPRIVPIDARWILYTGIRQHFTIERPDAEFGVPEFLGTALQRLRCA